MKSNLFLSCLLFSCSPCSSVFSLLQSLMPYSLYLIISLIPYPLSVILNPISLRFPSLPSLPSVISLLYFSVLFSSHLFFPSLLFPSLPFILYPPHSCGCLQSVVWSLHSSTSNLPKTTKPPAAIRFEDELHSCKLPLPAIYFYLLICFCFCSLLEGRYRHCG